jgi:hypothetical protein
VDALAVEGAAAASDLAAALQLDLPVVRLDGIPVDQVTWSALLCARLGPPEPADAVSSDAADEPWDR